MFISILERQELPVISGTVFEDRQNLPVEEKGQHLPVGKNYRSDRQDLPVRSAEFAGWKLRKSCRFGGGGGKGGSGKES